MNRLKSFLGLVTAMAATVLGVQAQDVAQMRAPVNQDAPAPVVKVGGETVASAISVGNVYEPRNDYKASASTTLEVKAASTKKAPSKLSPSARLAGDYVLTGTSALTSGYNGNAVTITAIAADSIAIADFWMAGYDSEVKARIDNETGVIYISQQVMGQDSQYGDIVFAKTNPADGQPMDGEVTATVDADGVIHINDMWGAYVKTSATATSWSYFSIVAVSAMQRCNATFTGKKHSDGTYESYAVIFTQTGENTATITNMGGYGHTVTIDLNRNKTANIPSSLIAYNSTYGDFYSYNLTFSDTGASLSSADAVTSVATDLKELNWTNWGVVTGNTKGSRYLVSAYDECKIVTQADIVYPSISVTELDGEGTEESPFLIKQRDDLILFSDLVAKQEPDIVAPSGAKYCRPYLGQFIKVTADIDMSGWTFTPVGADWNHSFAGTFDGDGHTISNLHVKASSYAGLFGRCDTVSVIKNVKIDNASVVATSSASAGVIAGWSLGTMTNVEVSNSSLQGPSAGLGTLAGIVNGVDGGKVTRCNVVGTYGYIGGAIGESEGPVKNVSVTGTKIQSAVQSSSTPGLPVGGVVGNLYLTTAENCYFSGVLDGYGLISQTTSNLDYQTIGGVVGSAPGATIKECFATGQITTYGSGSISGGVVGYLRGDVENSFFSGTIVSPSTRKAGGAVGYLNAYTMNNVPMECNIKNVYAVASISAETYQYQSQTDHQNNEIIGTIPSTANPNLENVYFDKQIAFNTRSVFGVNTSDLTSASGPAGFDASKWTFTAGQYPALKNLASTDASHMATAAVVMPEGSTFDFFSKNATINKASDILVGFYKEGEVGNQGYFASISGSTIELNNEVKFGNDTIFFVAPNYVGSYYRIAKIAPVPFEGIGTEESPFQLKTKQDLIALSQMTTVSHQLFADTYFKVMNDIDVELDEAFLGICADPADAHNYFAGQIDGDGHTIDRIKFDNVLWKTPGTETSWGTIDTSNSSGYRGFIGRLEATGVVKNLNIGKNCSFNFYAQSGALVGYNSGLVENCRNYADISAYSCWIGGIVGQNLKEGRIKDCYNEGNIIDGYAWTGGIAGSNVGLIERCMNVGRIEVCQRATNYATNLNMAGGIVGSSSSGGRYVDCVNAGTVSAQLKTAGGLVGSWGVVSATSTASYYPNDMMNCISYGTVLTADLSTIGALVGGTAQSTSTNIYGNYWDAQICDLPADANAEHEGMTGVERSVLTSGQALEGFDTEVWKFEAGKYPVLRRFADEPMVQIAATTTLQVPAGVTSRDLTADATVTAGTPALAAGTDFTLDGMTLKGIENATAVVRDTLTITNDKFVKIITLSALPRNPLQGSGTEEDPWQLHNPQEWTALAGFIHNTANPLTGEYVKVMNDIDFTGYEAGITPFGSDGVTTFAGHFDGNNCTVKGFDYSTTIAAQGALFGTIDVDASVKDLTVEGVAKGGQGVNAKGTVVKYGYAAMLAGKVYGTVTNVTTKGSVTGITTYTAGVAGYAYQGAKFENVVNEAEVSSPSASVAGIAAYVYEDVEFINCKNTGKLSSATAVGYVGGIAAYSLPATYIDCVNEGEINAGTSAGIVANCAGKANVGPYTFERCINKGNITGAASLGGITAMQGTTVGNNKCYYIDCVNEGDITANSATATSSSSTAGIAAFHTAGSVFDGCINYGNITNSKSVYTAGITGYYKGAANAANPEVVKNCQNYGNIAAEGQQIAGIIAYVSNYVTIDSCYNYGNIEQGTWGAAGIVYMLAGANSACRNCFNAGNVTVGTYNAGGIVGNNSTVNVPIENCVNTGTISSLGKATTATGNYGIGGIAGGAYASLTNCVNFGAVNGYVRTGGIVGSPSFHATTPRTKLYNCINYGPVKGDEGSAGAIVGTLKDSEATYWGETNVCENCYYLNDFTHKGLDYGTGDNNVVGTGMSVKQLTQLNMNAQPEGTDAVEGEEAWFKPDFCFPVPAVHAEQPGVEVKAAAVVLGAKATESGEMVDDTFDNVTVSNFNVGTHDINGEPTVAWDYRSAQPSILTISGNNVAVNEVCKNVEVTLVATFQRELPFEVVGVESEEWKLILNVDTLTGIDDTTVDKVVKDEVYFNVNGARCDKPSTADGQVYIVIRTFEDGTVKAYKVRN